MARTAIAEFGVIQKELKNAVVTIYVADEHGQNTGVLATLYRATTGTTQLTNPQTLDEDGKLPVEVWVEDFVVAEITNISQQTERRLLKIRANPLTYPLPVTSSGKNSTDIINAKEDAETAAATATAQAVIATTQAGTATTQATNAATSASTATTQAGIATTKAAEASVSAAQAAASAAGMKRKSPARAATTGALPACTYANGTAGVGATLTADANGAFPTQDGVTLLAGESCLVKNQASSLQNGIYVLTQAGSAGTPWILTRHVDSDTWDEIVAAIVTVTEGSTFADTDFLCTSNAGGTMGATNITWQQQNSVIADGAVSTAEKILNNIITYAKMLSTEFATSSQLLAGMASKFVDAAGLKAAAPNMLLQFVRTETTASDSTTLSFPLDGTIPQNTEGKEWTALNTTFTPKSATSLLEIEVHVGMLDSSSNNVVGFALFRDSVADAIIASAHAPVTANYPESHSFKYVMVSGQTTPIDFKVRFGCQGGTGYINRYNGLATPYGANTVKSYITIREYNA